MSFYRWFTRCIPAFSACAIGALLILALVVEPHGKGQKGHHHGKATLAQLILSAYTIILHLLSVAFPARVCYAMSHVIKRTRETAASPTEARRWTVVSKENAEGTPEAPAPLFVIILPAYKEETDTLEETLRVLACHPRARHCYHVYLAMEEKEDHSAFKAAQLCGTFKSYFYNMSYTVHPANIPGEAQGKSSNESWAARQVSKDYPEDSVKQNVLMTIMDADTHLSARYFQEIARHHIENAETNQTTMYVPPLVFDRNLHRVPLPVRTADLMWAGAGLSSLYSGSTVCIPTSVYSLPMDLVEHVGGWDTDPGAIGEDLHMYLKCFFALSGNLDVQVVYAAASQCNVSSDLKGISGYLDGLNARHKQALRHMWGSLDTGFAVRLTVEMLGRHRRASRYMKEDLPLSAPKGVNRATNTLMGVLTLGGSGWAAPYTSSRPREPLARRVEDSEAAQPAKPIHKLNVLTLYHRMFEAHFLPIHLVLILASSAIYDCVYPTLLVPHTLRYAFDVTGWCRLVGFCLMMLYFYLYEKYHRLCLGLRVEEMRRAGLLEDMEVADGFSDDVFQFAGILEAAAFPLGGIVFGALPALQAVFSHLFTERLIYVVSLKPQLAAKRWNGNATP